MPKDNENILLPLDGPITPSEPVGFAPAEMIRCEECLRANPPTRLACLYCGTTLPAAESSVRLRRPTLLSPDKADPGYNIIFSSYDQTRGSLLEAADVLKLGVDTLEGLTKEDRRLPLARTATVEEAELVRETLRTLGLETTIVSDKELALSETNVIRLRSIKLDENTFTVHASGRADLMELAFSDLMLLVQARLLTKTITVKERQTRSSENEILDASEFFADEAVIDLYLATHNQTFRVCANSFDFSCFGSRKALVVSANMSTLNQVLKAKAPQLEEDNSYGAVKHLLDVVWGSEKVTKSDGWRRERPGRVTVAASTSDSNENQFTRYSRLRFRLRRQK